ncbi:MAG: hypothetical protein DHS20C11_28480 [Lysobacteraceae bacterium]|nr:MAG: hypothetical protein DHS20C11_28480 [Xanthomonadaceae bacterium]
MRGVIPMIPKIEIWAGSALIVVSALFQWNSHVCVFNQASCGMVEGLIAVYSLVFGLGLVVGGLASMHCWKFGLLAHLPIAYAVVLFATMQ